MVAVAEGTGSTQDSQKQIILHFHKHALKVQTSQNHVVSQYLVTQNLFM